MTTSDYFVGLDLGQANDPTALAVLERTERTVEAADGARPFREVTAWHFACRGLKRWPLGTPYTAIVTDMEALVRTPTLTKATLVVDGTGVGRPVVDMFRNAQLPVLMVPVMITAGRKQTFHDGYYHVAKTILINALQAALRQRRLQFAQGLAEVTTLLQELQNFRVRTTEAANEVFEARQGKHDDLLLALALACWHGERSPKPGPFRVDVLTEPKAPAIWC